MWMKKSMGVVSMNNHRNILKGKKKASTKEKANRNNNNRRMRHRWRSNWGKTRGGMLRVNIWYEMCDVRQWLPIGKVDNVVIELWVYTCTAAGRSPRQKRGDTMFHVEGGNANGSVDPLAWKSWLVSLTHPCCGCILALLASKKFQFVFWCQVSPADRLVVDHRMVFFYVVI